MSTVLEAEFVTENPFQLGLIGKRVHDDDVGQDVALIRLIGILANGLEMYETELAVRPPKGFYFELVPRSSLVKAGRILGNSMGIIDPSYTGTIKVALWPIGENRIPLMLPFVGFQLILRPAYYPTFRRAQELSATTRGDGGFGSTNSTAGGN